MAKGAFDPSRRSFRPCRHRRRTPADPLFWAYDPSTGGDQQTGRIATLSRAPINPGAQGAWQPRMGADNQGMRGGEDVPVMGLLDSGSWSAARPPGTPSTATESTPSSKAPAREEAAVAAASHGDEGTGFGAEGSGIAGETDGESQDDSGSETASGATDAGAADSSAMEDGATDCAAREGSTQECDANGRSPTDTRTTDAVPAERAAGDSDCLEFALSYLEGAVGSSGKRVVLDKEDLQVILRTLRRIAKKETGSTASGSTASGSTASGSTASGSTASGSTAAPGAEGIRTDATLTAPPSTASPAEDAPVAAPAQQAEEGRPEMDDANAENRAPEKASPKEGEALPSRRFVRRQKCPKVVRRENSMSPPKRGSILRATLSPRKWRSRSERTALGSADGRRSTPPSPARRSFSRHRGAASEVDAEEVINSFLEEMWAVPLACDT